MWHLWSNGLVGVTVQYTVMHAYNPISRLVYIGWQGEFVQKEWIQYA
jgi:hypothetical protein